MTLYICVGDRLIYMFRYGLEQVYVNISSPDGKFGTMLESAVSI